MRWLNLSLSNKRKWQTSRLSGAALWPVGALSNRHPAVIYLVWRPGILVGRLWLPVKQGACLRPNETDQRV